MDLIKDLWRGDIPLVKTFWLFGMGAEIFFKIVFAYIKSQQRVLLSAPFGAIFMLGFACFVIVYQCLVWVGIWRSANKYQGRPIYAGLAKFSVLLAIIQFLSPFLKRFYSSF